MQLSGILRQEELISFLICLLLILSWKLLLGTSNIPRYSSNVKTHEAAASKSKESTRKRADRHRDSRKLPWDFQAPGNQCSTRAAENECNYADFVPNYEAQASAWELAKINIDVSKHFSDELLEDIRELFLTSVPENSEDSLEICDAFNTAQKHRVEETMETFGKQDSRCSVKIKISLHEVERPKCDIAVVETISSKQLIPQETLSDESEDRVILRKDSAQLSCKTTDQLEEKPEESVDETIFENSYTESSEELKKHAEYMCGCKTEVDRPAFDEQNYLKNKPLVYLIIGKSNSNENLDTHLEHSKTEFEEHSEMRTSSFEENFEEPLVQKKRSETEFNKHSDEKIINLDGSASMKTVKCSENEFTENVELVKNAEEECEISLHDDVSHCRSPDKCSSLTEDPEVRSQKEANYLDDQFGVFSEKETNYTKEKSIIHSSKSTTQSQREEEEGEVEFGSPPDANSRKHVREAECTDFLIQRPTTSQGKEEEDLNAIIRSMIITELRKHREREVAALKRAHSDTESAITNRNKNRSRNKTVLFNSKNQAFFRGLRESEENPIKDREDQSVKKILNVLKIEKIEKKNNLCESSTNHDENLKSLIEIHAKVTNNLNDNSVNEDSKENTCFPRSNILLERKVNLPSFVDDEREEIIRAGKNLTMDKKPDVSKSTQTEHVYVIHAVRSCPLRKWRSPLYLQLQRLTSSHSGVSSKTIYPSRDFAEFIFRKASDNLIYEKGKGSSSPSYIPLPERFRWRYLTPGKSIAKNSLSKCVKV